MLLLLCHLFLLAHALMRAGSSKHSKNSSEEAYVPSKYPDEADAKVVVVAAAGCEQCQTGHGEKKTTRNETKGYHHECMHACKELCFVVLAVVVVVVVVVVAP